jgi:diphosphomevalonate decarboxylase
MSSLSATAIAHPNIALIKYWGNQNETLRIPVNGSISINLAGLTAQTRVIFSSEFQNDQLVLNQQPTFGPALKRVCEFLDIVRQRAGLKLFASVTSQNNFPTAAGVASSAAAFAALSLAASQAAGLSMEEKDLSALARRGSGSAARSVPGGFVEWLPGTSDQTSYAVSIAAQDHWDLVDCIAIVQNQEKPVGSTQGHALADTSPLQAGRVSDAPRRLDICRSAIQNRDFEALSKIVELDSNWMHSVMMTSDPALFYWQPASLVIMQQVQVWRRSGLPVCFTLDAGPNVHLLTLSQYAPVLQEKINLLPGLSQLLIAPVGGCARLI